MVGKEKRKMNQYDAVMIAEGVMEVSSEEEYLAAHKAGIPVLPIAATGGPARKVKATANWKAARMPESTRRIKKPVDAGDVASAVVEAVRRCPKP